MELSRRKILKGGAAAGVAGVAGSAAASGSSVDVSDSASWGEELVRPDGAYADYDPEEDKHVVAQDGSGDYETIQAAVDAVEEARAEDAEGPDLILVEPGVYTSPEGTNRAVVEVNESEITIRGTDREDVIVDGKFGSGTDKETANGIFIKANDVVVENLTVRNVKKNGVYWLGIDADTPLEGYRASYVTAQNIGHYAIYTRTGMYGRFEHCYTSGSDDAGFYIGESQPAHAVIDDCVTEYNAMGYSGTNAGGNLVIKNSIWRENMVGIVPNTLDSQEGAPQGHTEHGGIRVENNEIHDNNRMDVPAAANAYAVYGSGVAIAGGQNNHIVGNTIENQDKYGIIVFPMITDTNPSELPGRIFRGFMPLLSDDSFYPPKHNAVEDNELSNSGRVGVALGAPADGNTFSNNDGGTRPMLLEYRDGSFGDPMVFIQILRDFAQTEFGYAAGDVKSKYGSQSSTRPSYEEVTNGEVEDIPTGVERAILGPDTEQLREDHDEYEMDDVHAPPRPAVEARVE